MAEFQYDKRESLKNDKYLTPVYFNKQVLIRYLYDSRFACKFVSETYGEVSGDDFSMSFGINRNGSVLAWLGDLENKIPARERLHWLGENKAPENDMVSEFHDAQINLKFTEPPAVVACLNSIAEFNSAFHKRFAVHLYKDRSVEERIAETARYKRLVMNNVDDFKRFVSEFNEILTENTNNDELRRFLSAQGVTLKEGLKGNKLLELVYKHVLNDNSNLIAPFFYLYDLRLWSDHALEDKLRLNVANNLGVAPDDYQKLFQALVAAITNSTKSLKTKL